MVRSRRAIKNAHDGPRGGIIMANHTIEGPALHRYNEDNELHVRAIDRLVHELGISAEEVNRSYREVLEELNKDNKVKAFLPILVSKGVKERLLGRR
jgi:hypothetical protein